MQRLIFAHAALAAMLLASGCAPALEKRADAERGDSQTRLGLPPAAPAPVIGETPPGQVGETDNLDTVTPAEAAAVQSAYEQMEAAGLETKADWQNATVSMQESVMMEPIAGDAAAGIAQDAMNGAGSDLPRRELADVIATEEESAAAWIESLAESSKAMADADLIAARKRLTVQIYMAEAFAANNHAENGFPPELFQLAVQTAAESRGLINDELRRRGIRRVD